MRRKAVLAGMALTLVLAAGCGKEADMGGAQVPSTVEIRGDGQPEGVGQKDLQEEKPEEESAEGEEPEQESRGEPGADGQKPPGEGGETDSREPRENGEEEFGFGDLAHTYFYFSSGVGGWYTELFIDRDGSFSGHYQDADMGDTGDSYPNGTLYESDFKGGFDSLAKVDGFTYKMKLASLTYAREPETEEILDGTRHIYSTAYGLDGGEEFYLYLPGADMAGLPEEYLSWVNNVNPEGERESGLRFYGLYNVKEREGFSSSIYEEKSLEERVADRISIAEERGRELEETLENASAQQEMNEAAAELFRCWDDALNGVWEMLETELGEAEMETLRNDERSWIAYKEQEVEAAGQKFTGGSMESMERGLKAAELTKKRVYELAEYSKNR